MPMRPENSKTFHRGLYAGWNETVTCLKRADDMNASQIRTVVLYDCVLPNTVVEGDALAVSKSFYSGEVVKLFSSSGIELNCTVNHPVLTDKGFIPAGKINPGTNLLCYNRNIKGFSADVKNRPSTIEEVFKSVSKRNNHFTSRKAKPLDFHGDGVSVQGKIDIIRPDRKLMQNVVPCGSECLTKFHLNGFDFSLPGKNRLGVFDSLFQRVNTPDSRNSSGQIKFFPNFRRHSTPLEFFGLTLISRRNSCFSQNSFNHPSVCGKTIGYEFDGLPTKKSFNDGLPVFVGGRRFRMGVSFASKTTCLRTTSQLHPRTDQPVHYGDVRNSEVARNLLRSFPREVTTDVVTKIKRFHYHGPVYNLETTVGYYTASTVGLKVFVGNCRWARIFKQGEPIAGQMASEHFRELHVPRIEMERVGVAYFNALDRFIDKQGRYWQPESDSLITVKLGLMHVCVQCRLTDPPVNSAAIG